MLVGPRTAKKGEGGKGVKRILVEGGRAVGVEMFGASIATEKCHDSL